MDDHIEKITSRCCLLGGWAMRRARIFTMAWVIGMILAGLRAGWLFYGINHLSEEEG